MVVTFKSLNYNVRKKHQLKTLYSSIKRSLYLLPYLSRDLSVRFILWRLLSKKRRKNNNKYFKGSTRTTKYLVYFSVPGTVFPKYHIRLWYIFSSLCLLCIINSLLAYSYLFFHNLFLYCSVFYKNNNIQIPLNNPFPFLYLSLCIVSTIVWLGLK